MELLFELFNPPTEVLVLGSEVVRAVPLRRTQMLLDIPDGILWLLAPVKSIVKGSEDATERVGKT
jgi:hypothetical protein